MNLNTIRVPTAFNSNYAAAGIPRMHCGGLSHDQMERRLEPHLHLRCKPLHVPMVLRKILYAP